MQNNIGKEEAKKLICMTHEHELRRGRLLERMGTGWRGARGKNWDNCNSIINKIYFYKKKKIKNFASGPGENYAK